MLARLFLSVSLALASFAAVAACHAPEPRQNRAATEPAPAQPTIVSAPTLAPPPAPPPPARVERFLVPGDLVASLVRSADGSPPLTVFLPGICSNAHAYLQTFPEAAQKQGGVVAIEGDQPCGNADGFRSFSWDATRLHARIEAALAAAGLRELPREGVTIVGYSQGAALAEQLVARWPERYGKVVLIGAPTDPSVKRLAGAQAVVTMSCERDVPARMQQASGSLARSGVPSRYVQMPGCTHGHVAEGERVFGETFEWLRENARPARADAAAIPLVGAPARDRG